MSVLNKTELTEILVHHFETTHSLPPLTSKLLAFMIVEIGDEGVTFDELVNALQASKSSISFSINQLLEMDKLDYIYKDCNRKRYFRLNPNHFKNRLMEINHNMESECQFFDLIYNYKKENGYLENTVFEVETYKTYMIKQKQLIEETLEKLEK